MPPPTIPSPRFGTDPQRGLSDLANGVSNAIRSLFTTAPHLDGVTVEGKCSFDSSGNPADTPVTHGLGRVAKGYHVAGLGSPFHLWTSSSQNPLPKSQLLLSHDASQSAFATFTLWVF